MKKEDKLEKKQNKINELFVKFFYLFARFSWFFGILISAIILIGMYRLLIQPQYQKIVTRQADIEKLNLEEERTRLIDHIERLNKFIELSKSITDDDKNHLDTLLQDITDTLVLQIQLEKYLESYDLLDSSISIGVTTYETDQTVATAPTNSRESIIDLSGIFEAPQASNQLLPTQALVKSMQLGSIPIAMNLNLRDYFATKDFIRDIESIVPLIDMHSISLIINTTPVNATSGNQNEQNTTQNYTAQLSLSGVLYVAKEQ